MLGDIWRFNPKRAIRAGETETVKLWFQAGGPDGGRHLPQAGGVLDQAALMMDAFAVIGGAWVAWEKLKRGGE